MAALAGPFFCSAPLQVLMQSRMINEGMLSIALPFFTPCPGLSTAPQHVVHKPYLLWALAHRELFNTGARLLHGLHQTTSPKPTLRSHNLYSLQV